MLYDVILFLKNALNSYLKLGGSPQDSQEDPVVFPDRQASDGVSFKLGAISILLLNLEQESILRPPDLYTKAMPDGSVRRVQPEIKLNLYVLFVANYQQYDDSLRNLSSIIQYFQSHRLFTQLDTPELGDNIEQLVVELVTLSFSEQNEIWGALRAHYKPSILYKVKMVVFQDQAPKEMQGITETVIRASA